MSDSTSSHSNDKYEANMERKAITLETKCRLVQSMVLSIATYGCENQTLKKQDGKKIDLFKLWYWGRLLRILWIAKVTNKQIPERVTLDMSLEEKIMKLHLTYCGHDM